MAQDAPQSPRAAAVAAAAKIKVHTQLNSVRIGGLLAAVQRELLRRFFSGIDNAAVMLQGYPGTAGSPQVRVTYWHLASAIAALMGVAAPGELTEVSACTEDELAVCMRRLLPSGEVGIERLQFCAVARGMVTRMVERAYDASQALLEDEDASCFLFVVRVEESEVDRFKDELRRIVHDRLLHFFRESLRTYFLRSQEHMRTPLRIRQPAFTESDGDETARAKLDFQSS